MNKQHILEEIRRTANSNGGVPLGRLRFFTETGIKESDWRGVHWVRWNEAVREAGFAPNQKTESYDEDWLLTKLIALARELGRFPVWAELRLRARTAPDFPSDGTFRRFGSKEQVVARVAEYCRAHKGFEDVLAMCPATDALLDPSPIAKRDNAEDIGFVYLLKSGRFYKIGRSNAFGRRERELAIQLPERANIVHSIRTDDPVGIEDYWHRRFDSRRKNGEWFELSAADLRAFRRRKFM
jgi:Meiotically up-regulated gene 113